MGEMQVLHCTCGATRQAPAHLPIVSCVKCGSAMSPRATATLSPPPPRTLVATATFASQLLGTLAFALALVWIIFLHITDAPILGVLAAGVVCVFAGGIAHRGSVIALAICATFDLAVAITSLVRLPAADALVWPALARVSADPAQLPVAMTVLGIAAALAAVACIAALPQAHRFGTWRTERILQAARVR